MPLPTLAFLALASGLAAALAAGTQLRLSLRPVLLTGSFGVYLIFLSLLFVPVSVYFYMFHGDWFLLYLVDVRGIPSAVALIGFLLEGGIGVVGFMFGASLARSQRTTAGIASIAACLVASIAVAAVCHERLGVIGSFPQYHGDFGLQSYASSNVMKGSLPMGALLGVGTVFLIWRLRYAGRRH